MKILFNTLSNIGDVILSLPALDRLIAVYPKADITVLCGERALGIFEDNFYIKRCIAFKRKVSPWDRIKLMLDLRKNEYDLIVDLKNSALPLFLKAKYKTYPWFNAPGELMHMSQRHLYKVKKFIPPLLLENMPYKEGAGLHQETPQPGGLLLRKALYISDRDRLRVANLLYEVNVAIDDKFILIGPGARSHIKRWPEPKFAELCDRLAGELEQKIVLVADNNDSEVCDAVKSQMHNSAVNLCGETSLKSLAALIEKAQIIISNDSAIMHLASYLDRPTLAIFGPTDYKKYGPWSSRHKIARSQLDCSPCEVAQCKRGDLKCMSDIGVDEVYEAAKELL